MSAALHLWVAVTDHCPARRLEVDLSDPPETARQAVGQPQDRPAVGALQRSRHEQAAGGALQHGGKVTRSMSRQHFQHTDGTVATDGALAWGGGPSNQTRPVNSFSVNSAKSVLAGAPLVVEPITAGSMLSACFTSRRKRGRSR